MRKTLFLSILISITTLCSFGQIIPSSCTAPDSIVELYNDDADRMALKHTFRNNLPAMDSVEIDQPLSDTLLKALLAVYNVVSIPSWDSLNVIHHIHNFPQYDLKELIFSADSSLLWVKELIKGNLATGQPKLDSLITNYNFSLEGQPWYPSIKNSVLLTFRLTENYNLQPILDTLEAIPGVNYAFQQAFFGDGHEIKDSIQQEYIDLTYSYGWTDCEIQCWYRRYWKFRVHPGCEVEYLGSYGDPASGFLGLTENKDEKIVVSPNPFGKEILVKGVSPGSGFVLYNTLGQTVQFGTLQSEAIKPLASLPPGPYFLVLTKGEKQLGSYHLIKQ